MNASEIPENVRQYLSQALIEINQYGEISTSTMYALHKSIEEESRKEHENAGYFRRAKIELACAYKVKPMWGECKTASHINASLELAIECLDGNCELSELEIIKDKVEVLIDDAQYNNECSLLNTYAAYACISALNTVLYDTDLESLKVSELNRKPEFWTACFNASLAYSGRETWASLGDVNRRKEFWMWLINIVIPSIWSPFAKPGSIK